MTIGAEVRDVTVAVVNPRLLYAEAGLFYTQNPGNKQVRRINPYTGAVVNVVTLTVFLDAMTPAEGVIVAAQLSSANVALRDPRSLAALRTIAGPGTAARGLAWDGHTLWLADVDTDLIYQLDPLAGTVLRSFAAPSGDIGDLAWDGATLWASDTVAGLIYQLDPYTGAVIRSFAAPASQCTGLAWVEGSLWVLDAGVDHLRQLSLN